MAKLTDAQREYIQGLTVDDALNDSEWGKMPSDFSEYLKFDHVVARGLKRATDADKVAFVDAMSAFLLTGELPDLDTMPAAAAILAEHVIQAHQAALPAVYLLKYKQHMTGLLAGRGEEKKGR